MKIMFVCHGNICRSPMAEFIFKKMLFDRGLSDKIFVDSSAVSSEELGNPVYPPVRRLLLSLGIDTKGKYAKTLEKSDYEKFDLIIGMDSSNIRGIRRIIGEDRDKKIFKLLDLTSSGGDVADPYYYGNYDKTYSDIKKGCEALLNKILAANAHK